MSISTIPSKIDFESIFKKIVSCDDEAIGKLTWEDVLELLQTA